MKYIMDSYEDSNTSSVSKNITPSIKAASWIYSLKGEEEKKANFESNKKELVEFLDYLKKLEASLWGSVSSIEEEEEKVVEDSNYLVYLISRGDEESAKQLLEGKEFNEFLDDIKKLRKQFKDFKKKIQRRDRLKNLVSKFTVKLVERDNYQRLEEIFVLEKQLYEVIEKQEKDLRALVKDISKMTVDTTSTSVEVYLNTIREIRDILSGHLEHHELWEEEREGFSNTSNILHALENRIYQVEY